MSELITVLVRQHVYSEVPGRVGNWSCQTELKLPWVPSPGFFICFTRPDGAEYLTEHVKNVIISTNAIHVYLRDVVTDSPGLLDEIDVRGWERLGGPWKEQTP